MCRQVKTSIVFVFNKFSLLLYKVTEAFRLWNSKITNVFAEGNVKVGQRNLCYIILNTSIEDVRA